MDVSEQHISQLELLEMGVQNVTEKQQNNTREHGLQRHTATPLNSEIISDKINADGICF
jgi:hypothetical protein